MSDWLAGGGTSGVASNNKSLRGSSSARLCVFSLQH